LTLTLLSPLGALLVLAAAVPLAAVALGARRVAATARVLSLDPDERVRRRRAVAAVIATALVALAAAQPALRTERSERTRTDAQAFIVVDISRSMLAAAAPGARTRFARAQERAIEIRDALPEVPMGVASLTDRVLPHLFPTPDRAVFAETVRRALAPKRPAPAEREVQATSLAALAAVPGANFFSPLVRRRLLIVLTDGETRPFDAPAVARALKAARIGLVLVRVGNARERVFTRGRPEPSYRPDPLAGQTIDALAAATGHTTARDFLGSGRTHALRRGERLLPLGPLTAVLALVPLSFLLRRPRSRKLALAN